MTLTNSLPLNHYDFQISSHAPQIGSRAGAMNTSTNRFLRKWLLIWVASLPTLYLAVATFSILASSRTTQRSPFQASNLDGQFFPRDKP